jgi:hypothetical protein
MRVIPSAAAISRMEDCFDRPLMLARRACAALRGVQMRALCKTGSRRQPAGHSGVLRLCEVPICNRLPSRPGLWIAMKAPVLASPYLGLDEGRWFRLF